MQVRLRTGSGVRVKAFADYAFFARAHRPNAVSDFDDPSSGGIRFLLACGFRGMVFLDILVNALNWPQ